MSRNARLGLAITYLSILGVFAGLSAVAITTSRRVELLVQDPAVAARGLPWFGLWSNFGVLLWCATAAVCLFTASVLRSVHGSRVSQQFLLAAGLVSLVLLIDDLYMVHDWLLPEHGVPQEVAYGVYGNVTVAFLVRFRTLLWGNYPRLFLATLGFFGGSVLVDVFGDAAISELTLESRYHRLKLVIEDGLKLLGIASWLHYFAYVSSSALRFLSPPHRLVTAQIGNASANRCRHVPVNGAGLRDHVSRSRAITARPAASPPVRSCRRRRW